MLFQVRTLKEQLGFAPLGAGEWLEQGGGPPAKGWGPAPSILPLPSPPLACCGGGVAGVPPLGAGMESQLPGATAWLVPGWEAALGPEQ